MEKHKMPTKERIIEESLTLFSIKGFKGTSVKEIADAVGIKDSSLYKHFKSKREIFDTIVLAVGKRMEETSKAFGLPTDANGLPGEDQFEEAAIFYEKLTLEGLQQLSRDFLTFYMTDPFMSRFWRMANIEQYQNEEIYNVFYKIYMEDSIRYQSRVFAEMSRRGILKDRDPEVMTISFYAPIFFLLSKYINRPSKLPEALELLERQVEDFYLCYNDQQEREQDHAPNPPCRK
ncbi:MAG: TetR/AcrR family transcriptional regulator [Bacillota bacterium]|nr:TetR/AcrR family transcriptional regulator [Bacillota bacterium]